MRRYWLSFFKFLCLDQDLRRGRDYRHTPCDTVIPNGGSQIKVMSARFALFHFCFCAFAGASSATLQNKNAPPERRGHHFDLRTGGDTFRTFSLETY